MTNVSLQDYEVLKGKLAEWSIFNQIFTSGEAGRRTPELGFYKHVIAEAGLDTRRTIFVDDKLENVVSACSLGLHGIVFDTPRNVTRCLHNLLGNPVKRGQEFLVRNAGHLKSITDTGITFMDNFTQLLILEATGNRKLVDIMEPPRAWNFFYGTPVLTTKEYPLDLDTTSLGWTVIKHDKEIVSSVMDEMLEYVDIDGIIQVYFDHRRPRFDPVVCVNILTLFYTYGRGPDLDRTLRWVHEVLLHRAYLDGTTYYIVAECFLFALTRLLACSDDPGLHRMFNDLLRERVQEQVGVHGDALALAMRLVTCASVNIKNGTDLRTLLGLQYEDGGGKVGCIYTGSLGQR